MAKQTNHLETILEVEVQRGVIHANFTAQEDEIAMGWIDGKELRRYKIVDKELEDTGNTAILEQPSTKVHMDAQRLHDWISLTYDYKERGGGIFVAEARIGEEGGLVLERRAIESYGYGRQDAKSTITSNGRYVALATGNSPLKVFELTPVKKRELENHKGGFKLEQITSVGGDNIHCKQVTFNWLGNTLVAYTEQQGKSYNEVKRVVRVYSFNGNKLKQKQQIEVDKEITALEISQDGTYLVTGTSKGINWTGSKGRYYPGQVVIYEKQRSKYKQVLSESMEKASILDVNLDFNSERVAILYQKERQTYLRIANVCIKGK